MKETSILHQSDRGVSSTEQWVLVSDQVLSRTIEDGMEFQLKQSDVSILCQVLYATVAGWLLVLIIVILENGVCRHLQRRRLSA